MIDKEYMEEYPIGTKIRYIGTYNFDFFGEPLTGMVGRVVDFIQFYPLVYLPGAKFKSVYSTKERPATVQTSWNRIEKLVRKNQQLLFSFME